MTTRICFSLVVACCVSAPLGAVYLPAKKAPAPPPPRRTPTLCRPQRRGRTHPQRRNPLRQPPLPRQRWWAMQHRNALIAPGGSPLRPPQRHPPGGLLRYMSAGATQSLKPRRAAGALPAARSTFITTGSPAVPRPPSPAMSCLAAANLHDDGPIHTKLSARLGRAADNAAGTREQFLFARTEKPVGVNLWKVRPLGADVFCTSLSYQWPFS